MLVVDEGGCLVPRVHVIIVVFSYYVVCYCCCIITNYYWFLSPLEHRQKQRVTIGLSWQRGGSHCYYFCFLYSIVIPY
jgi:hypothetical protein